jgi:hypothetical protein
LTMQTNNDLLIPSAVRGTDIVVAELPKLYGPRVLVIVLKTSD